MMWEVDESTWLKSMIQKISNKEQFIGGREAVLVLDGEPMVWILPFAGRRHASLGKR